MSFLESSGNLDVDTIMAMHRYRRPKGSRTEQAFIDAYIRPLGAKDDKWGNYHLTIGDKPNILWSSHTDTVHNDEGFQCVSLSDTGILTLAKGEKANCLGADDGAGVWLMCEMIKAKIPGLYIFHYGEEKGCIGSEAISKHAPEILKDIKIAVAFDRRDFYDVITHMTTRVCSETFANSLIKQLPAGYKLCDSGARTDVKLYERIIDECVNISVGYTLPHSANETLDVKHLIKLRDAILKIDVSKLVISRNKNLTEYKYGGGSNYSRHSTYEHKATPLNLHEIVKRHSKAIADMMQRAGVSYDDLMHLVIEEQKMNPPSPTTYDNPLLDPPKNWKNPHDPATKGDEKDPAAAPAADAGSQPDAATKKDISPHHISAPGAADAVAAPSRGGGSPNNVHTLRTGNPATDTTPRHRHHLGSE